MKETLWNVTATCQRSKSVIHVYDTDKLLGHSVYILYAVDNAQRFSSDPSSWVKSKHIVVAMTCGIQVMVQESHDI